MYRISLSVSKDTWYLLRILGIPKLTYTNLRDPLRDLNALYLIFNVYIDGMFFILLAVFSFLSCENIF